jgi:hypothetical protein
VRSKDTQAKRGTQRRTLAFKCVALTLPVMAVCLQCVSPSLLGGGGGGESGGSTGTSNSSNTSTSSSSTTGASASSSGAQCSSPLDCVGMDTKCMWRTCDAGVCGVYYSTDKIDEQDPGDCLVTKCDGKGNPTPVPDDSDTPDSGNPCIKGACSAGARLFLPSCDAGAPCADGGAECISQNCVDGSCCVATSCPPCTACNVNGQGTCANLTQGTPCPGSKHCNGKGQCFGDFGDPCATTLDCANGHCGCKGTCLRAEGDPCTYPSECYSNRCKSSSCVSCGSFYPCKSNYTCSTGVCKLDAAQACTTDCECINGTCTDAGTCN